MRSCDILTDVKMPKLSAANNCKVTYIHSKIRADLLSTEQIFQYFDGHPWFWFKAFFDSESVRRPPLWGVTLSGNWNIYGRGKGHTFSEALKRAFNQFITRNEKMRKEQKSMEACNCCLDALCNLHRDPKTGICYDEKTVIEACPYCGRDLTETPPIV